MEDGEDTPEVSSKPKETKTKTITVITPVTKTKTTTVTSTYTIIPKKKKTCISTVYIFVEAKSVHRVSPDGSLVREDLPPCTNTVLPPTSIQDINSQVLRSAVAIFPGKSSKYLLCMQQIKKKLGNTFSSYWR